MLDWKTGIEKLCSEAGRSLRPGEFDKIIDRQAELQKGRFLDYSTIMRDSLMAVLDMDSASAADIANSVGRWPLYADVPALRALMEIAPCAAMTNSDRRHGEDIQAQLGFRLDTWLCAEDTRVYKPNPEFWHEMSRIRRIEPSASWWHVSAYADYDLSVARELGLTTVFVQRSHSRPAPATHVVADLYRFHALLV